MISCRLVSATMASRKPGRQLAPRVNQTHIGGRDMAAQAGFIAGLFEVAA